MRRRIGIRVADGTFYPILDDDEDGRRRLIVTTAQDNQTVIRIQFVREDATDGSSAALGTLEFEGVEPAPKSDADIELSVGVDAGTLSAWARDVVSGEKHELSVSLSDAGFDDFDLPDLGIEPDASAAVKDVSPAAASHDVPLDPAPPEFDADDFDTADLGDDFDLDGEPEEEARHGTAKEPASGDSGGLLPDDDLTGDAYPMGSDDSRRTHLVRQRRGRLWMVFILVGAVVLIAAAAVVVIRGLATESSPAWIATVATWGDAVLGERVSDAEPRQRPDGSDSEVPMADSNRAEGTASAAGSATTAAEDTASQGSSTSAAPAASEPATDGGEFRTLRRGDTLWDLSNSYYQNPRRYPEIAQRNNISNPDLILAGTKIFIPEL